MGYANNQETLEVPAAICNLVYHGSYLLKLGLNQDYIPFTFNRFGLHQYDVMIVSQWKAYSCIPSLGELLRRLPVDLTLLDSIPPL
jgi:hypothetical protein